MADVLRVAENARIRLTRNGIDLYNQVYQPTAETYTEHAADRVVLATNMGSPEAASLGGVASGEHLMLVTDQPIKVGVSSSTYLWDVKKFLMLNGTISSLYLQNESTTNLATVEFIVTD